MTSSQKFTRILRENFQYHQELEADTCSYAMTKITMPSLQLQQNCYDGIISVAYEKNINTITKAGFKLDFQVLDNSISTMMKG